MSKYARIYAVSKTTYKKPSLYSALRTLERFFASSNSDSVTKQEMISSWQRDKPQYHSKNDKWLYNKLTSIYDHDLARPTYAHDPYKRLASLDLTDKGKRALREPGNKNSEIKKDATRVYRWSSLTGWSIEDLLEAAEGINQRLDSYRIRINLEPLDE